MKLPLHIAKSLKILLESENKYPSSAMKHAIVNNMLEDGVLNKHQISKSKAFIYLKNKETLCAYLQNNFGINDLNEYIIGLENDKLNRSESVTISSNSKLKAIRTFKGFLVNCYEPIEAVLNDSTIIIHPAKGSYLFICDFEHFKIEKDVIIVGVENAENFAKIHQQQYLFEHQKVLFVSRYPQHQSKDLINWLQKISNSYLHFGDLDFAGISIYLSEFKKYLGTKASFFLPQNTEDMIQQFGNRNLFNKQFQPNKTYINIEEEKSIQELYGLILKYKKVLEQEVFIMKTK
jgi:hypothetical protein